MHQKSKETHFKVRAPNNLIHLKMKEVGIRRVAGLVRKMNMPTQSANINELVNMSRPARNKSGEWTLNALRIATFFHCLPEDLFSEEQQGNALGKKKVALEVSFEELRGMLEIRGGGDTKTPELIAQAAELRAAVLRALISLTPMEERVLRLRFGFGGQEEHSLEEIAAILNFSREWIRLIEKSALRKLRYHSRSAPILAAVSIDEGRSDLVDQGVLDALH